MGILMMFFSTKIGKRKIFETLKHGDFNIFFLKKWKINIFYMCLEFIHMRVWTIFFTEENENILHFMGILIYRSMRFSSLLTAKKYFSKMTLRRLQLLYLVIQSKKHWKYALFVTSYSKTILLKNDNQKIVAVLLSDLKHKKMRSMRFL